jgi:hypothetical protein
MQNDYRLMNMIDEKARLAGSNKNGVAAFLVGFHRGVRY